MKIVIAGGSGFLGRPLAAALAADGHDVVTLTRGDGPRRGQTRSRAVAWTPDGDSRPLGRRRSTAPAPSSTWPASRSPAAAGAPRRSSGFSTAACSATRSLVAAITGRRRAAAGLRQRIGGRLLRPARRRGRHRGDAGRQRFPGGGLRAVGSRSDARRDRPHARRLHPDRARARTGRRRAAADAAAVQVRRRRAGRIGPPVLAVDSPRRLDRARAVGDRDAGGGRRRSTRPRPNPVTNAEFARALGRAMHRPAFMPAPAFALRLMLGEMADALLLSGQRAVPASARAPRLHVPLPEGRPGAGALFG